MMSPLPRLVLIVLSLALLPGCTWWRGWVNAPQAPQAFSTAPSLQQIAEHINNNQVRQLETERARISLDGLPSLSARLALERPRNLRFRVETGLTGPELDVGSNDELFWMWAKRSDAVFFARHNQYAGSAARQMLPIQPEWISEALGIMYFDPQGQHEGPYDRGNHRVEIISRIPSTDGDLKRVLIVNDVYGWILEQHLYDQRGQLLASSKTSNHRYYPADGVSLPHKIEIQLPPAQLSFALDVAQYRINALSISPEQLWAMPQFEGYEVVDVADPRFSIPAPNANTGYSPPNNRTGHRPEVRGLEQGAWR